MLHAHTVICARARDQTCVYARAECLEPACTQYEVFDLREFGPKYNTVAVDNCKIIIVGHTSRLVTNVTFSLRNMPSFYLSKVPVYLARPPEHTTRCFSKSRTVMNTTMCVKWLLQQDSTTRSHSGGGMLAKCTPLTGRTCRVSQT